MFLSHSYLDKTLVLTLVSLFNEAGYSIYVDWIDDSQLNRDGVSNITANFIKERIKQSKGLAYISTQNIISSKWCPWDLGIADGMHNGRACILPILNQEDIFNGQEYLGIYPFIDYANSTDEKKRILD